MIDVNQQQWIAAAIMAAVILTTNYTMFPAVAEEVPEIPVEAPEPVTAPTEEFTVPETTEAVTEPETEPAQPTEYITAHAVWDYLTGLGMTDAAAAGIMGNLMIETGGGTLELHPDAYGENGCYYGLCQWNKWDFPEVQGQDLDYQLQYLRDTMRRQLGDRLDGFMAEDDPENAALTFAIWYERCAEYGYGIRQKCAREAFDYWR